MDYDSVLEALFERHRSVQNAGFSADAYKPGLEQMEDYAAFLGNPQDSFPSVHVAGTNGKGSVCSLIARALALKGYGTGLYTSPHLVDFRERIKIVRAGGYELIPKEAVADYLGRFDREGLSFFEVTTGMAFKWFASLPVDWAVIETGLGGRLDSTNIITPRISIITSIGLDHCALLGNTRAEIAAEKAGIFKSGVPALVWGRDPETSPVFESVAARVGAPLYYAEDFPLPEADTALFDLAGPCLLQNLRTVWAALSILHETPESPLALRDAARKTGFRGRWETLLEKPLTICDIGHNPPALEANFGQLERLRGSGPSRRPLLMVYGAMADKDVDSIAGLMPLDAEYFLVAPRTPRAMAVKDLALKLKKLNFTESGTVPEGVSAALSRARGLAGSDPVVYIGGSTFVVAEAISYLESI